MLTNVTKLKNVLSKLHEQHQKRIKYLELKISEYELEISQIKNLIQEEKTYEC